jgi:YHS domain-containing protein
MRTTRLTKSALAGLVLPGLLVGLFVTLPLRADEDHRQASTPQTQAQQHLQTRCPVMVGNKIDPDIYTVYRGKKVFFCCLACKSEFIKNPQKYLPRLVQFADETQQHDHVQGSSGGLTLTRLTRPTGIATLSLVAMTVCLGLLRKLKRPGPRVLLKLHKTAGICALCSGAIHAAIVLLGH